MRMRQQQRGKPHRLMTELGTDGGFRGRAVIALVEQQIERPVNGRKSRRELGRRGNVEQPLRCREQLLCPRYPFLDCSMAADEGVRDLVYAEAAEDVENERDLRLLARRGWQQENIIRSRSSLIALTAKSSSTAGASVHSLSSRRPSSGANVCAMRWRRRTSSARFFAVASSHAEGFSGTPRNFHTSSARQKASCTTSSASARLCTPNTRVRVATMRPASRRNR